MMNQNILLKKTNMRKKIISYLSDGLLIAAVIIGGYAFIKSYILKSGLPTGVCPINTNRPLMYAAIVLCGASLILSLFGPKVSRTQKNTEKGKDR